MRQIPEEWILSGNYLCAYESGYKRVISITWILGTAREVLALCTAVWTTVRHFRALRQLGPLTGSTIGDCFVVLIKTHMFYFAG
jgi:hypothetical protein